MKRFFYLLLFCFMTVGFLVPQPVSSAVVPVENTLPDPAKTFRLAVKEFRKLPKSEKKARLKEVKKQIKEFKKNRRAGAERPDQTLLIILAILLPPLAVYLHQGEVNNKFWLSLVLTLIFWLPGVIYALVVVLDADS